MYFYLMACFFFHELFAIKPVNNYLAVVII